MKIYTSFDFDHTLYDPETNKLIPETYDIIQQLIADKAPVCITTLRGENELDKVREFFPDIQIFPTNGFNKVICLKKYIPVPIAIHYDDDLSTCVSLLSTKIKPVWVRNEKIRNGLKKLKILEI